MRLKLGMSQVKNDRCNNPDSVLGLAPGRKNWKNNWGKNALVIKKTDYV